MEAEQQHARSRERVQASGGGLTGQMLRGGRSWPSDRNVGAATRSDGKPTVDEPGEAKVGAWVVTIGVLEQQAEHRLHLPSLPC